MIGDLKGKWFNYDCKSNKLSVFMLPCSKVVLCFSLGKNNPNIRMPIPVQMTAITQIQKHFLHFFTQFSLESVISNALSL